jgi:lactoylglutathione lyase
MINLYTADIEAGLIFYRDLFGFSETFRPPLEGIPSHVELQLDGFTLGLGTVEAAREVHGVEPTPGSPAMVIVIWTDDLDMTYSALVSAGIPIIQPPHETGNSNHNLLIHDPDGNLVEVVAKTT